MPKSTSGSSKREGDESKRARFPSVPALKKFPSSSMSPGSSPTAPPLSSPGASSNGGLAAFRGGEVAGRWPDAFDFDLEVGSLAEVAPSAGERRVGSAGILGIPASAKTSRESPGCSAESARAVPKIGESSTFAPPSRTAQLRVPGGPGHPLAEDIETAAAAVLGSRQRHRRRPRHRLPEPTGPPPSEESPLPSAPAAAPPPG